MLPHLGDDFISKFISIPLAKITRVTSCNRGYFFS